MKGFKKCENGHYYKEDLPGCPYCPGGNQTAVEQPGSDLEKTQIAGAGTATVPDSGDKTVVVGGGQAQGAQPKRDLSKTYIQPSGDSTDDDGEKSAPRMVKKLVGWLVSYTIDEMGVDYKVYEGRNTVGSGPSNNITVHNDVSVSSNHMLILFKKNEFFIKDEMSTNGSWINEEELTPGDVYKIKDGDKIKAGNTEFIFKTPL